jgi:L-cysteine desulfidase
MKRQRTTGVLAVLGALFVVVLGATAAAAQAPEKVVIQVDDEFVDEGLSEECGVDVTVTQTGRVTMFIFPDGKVLQNLTTLNLVTVFTAGDNQIRTRDVGIDQVRVQRDGTLILSIVGQVPVGFTGVLKINPETEEVLHEPHHVVDIEEFCAQLTA